MVILEHKLQGNTFGVFCKVVRIGCIHCCRVNQYCGSADCNCNEKELELELVSIKMSVVTERNLKTPKCSQNVLKMFFPVKPFL